MNAANEEAVGAFLQRRIRFTQIHEVNQRTMDRLVGQQAEPQSVDDLLALDHRARTLAAQLIAEVGAT
jgi:1-deoxy-D-xylulose-5-phosphate reductoisomerase